MFIKKKDNIMNKFSIKLPQIKLNPAINIIKENHLENQDNFIYHLEMDEKELMDYIKSIKATPNTLISLLLSKAIKKENIQEIGQLFTLIFGEAVP